MRSGDAGSFAGRRCLVTGGLGFIGSTLARRLAEADADVTVIDALVPRHGGNRRNLDGVDVEVVVADLADATAVDQAVEGAEFVFNLAGQVSHVDSMEDPLGDLDLNTRSQLAFLEMLRRVDPDAVVVYSSTRQVYGRPRYLPVDEDHPIRPVDVNGVSKRATEQLHLVYADTYGLRASSIRLTNVYGPRQRLLGDHLGFLPVFIRRALTGEEVTVWGDGTQERDCLYVDDAVEVLLAAARAPDAVGEVFNAGHPERLTLLRIAEIVVAAAGTGEVELQPWPPERARIDIGSYATDSSKAKRVLGWSPHVGFTEGVARTVEFYRAHARWYL